VSSLAHGWHFPQFGEWEYGYEILTRADAATITTSFTVS